MFCIGMYQRSRSAYKYISKYLQCPSATTLDSQLQNVPFNTGCNNILLKYLYLAAKDVKDEIDLYTVLLWDEMSIQPTMYYDMKNDKIVGFEDWGMRRTRKIAEHAIVFYMRCLASGNHIPLGYGFCNNATNTVQLTRCVKQWLMLIIKSGFKPVATVCDQGGTNIACIKLLIEETNKERQRQHTKPRDTFVIKEQEIVPLFDYVHLQKGVRNNLLTKDLLINKFQKGKCQQYACWKDIQQVYEMDKQSLLRQRQMPKLTNKHVIPRLIPKMKVKYATQILSHTVANFMDVVLHLNKGNMTTQVGEMFLPQSAAGTANVILFFDDLLDSFNGKQGQGLSSIMHKSSGHLEYLHEAVQKLRGMEYVEQESHKTLRRNGPKCLKNWIWTIQGSITLWTTLSELGFSHLNLKHLNQDVVENFFSQIRGHGHRNINPTPHQFSAFFKTLLCTNLTSKKSVSSNCKESEEGTSLPLLQMLQAGELASQKKEDNKDVECSEPAIPLPEVQNKNVYIDANKIVEYMKKQNRTMECPECAECIRLNSLENEITMKLEIANREFQKFCYEQNIKEKLVNIFYEDEWTMNTIHCPTLQQTFDIKIAEEFIKAWCTFMNNILQGNVEMPRNCDYVFYEAQQMSKRFEKKRISVSDGRKEC